MGAHHTIESKIKTIRLELIVHERSAHHEMSQFFM